MASELVVTVSCAFTVMVNCLLAVWAVGVYESVTVTVNVDPAPVGVPEIAHVLVLRVNPAGKLPVVTDQV